MLPVGMLLVVVLQRLDQLEQLDLKQMKKQQLLDLLLIMSLDYLIFWHSFQDKHCEDDSWRMGAEANDAWKVLKEYIQGGDE